MGCGFAFCGSLCFLGLIGGSEGGRLFGTLHEGLGEIDESEEDGKGMWVVRRGSSLCIGARKGFERMSVAGGFKWVSKKLRCCYCCCLIVPMAIGSLQSPRLSVHLHQVLEPQRLCRICHG